LLEKNPETHLHLRELQTLLEGEHVLQEIIFACSATTEGEDTVALVQERIAPIVQKKNLRMTLLGRGLSTGTELEYVDVATMKNALSGRTEKHG
jgi:recombination protein RecR